MNTDLIYQLHYAKHKCCWKTKVYKLHSVFLQFKVLAKFIFHLIRLVRGKFSPYFILLGSRELSRRYVVLKTFPSEFSSLDCILMYQVLSGDYQVLSGTLVPWISDAWCSLLVSRWATLQVILYEKLVSLSGNLNNATENSNSHQICSVTWFQQLNNQL